MSDLKPEKIAFISSIGGGVQIAGFFYPSHAAHIKGVIQICHGMAEYLSRFEEMIERFNEAGYHVCGMDMPGHGVTYEINKDKGFPKGYFGGLKNGWQVLLTDVMGFHEYAVRRFGREGLKYILFGHSMGSFVVRGIFSTVRYNKQFDGYVFASTSGKHSAVGIGRFLAGTSCFFGGRKRKNHILEALVFANYNRRIKRPKTVCDWIATNEEDVKNYMDDPLCGFTFTGDGYRTLFGLISFIQSKTAYAQLSDRPCFFTYGMEDPVGQYGKGVEEVISKMKAAGADVKSKCYGPYRHELHFEPIKEELYSDLIEFFDSVDKPN